ncbi:MAG TPA: sugar porter family MFS transporter [Steroidobacteraceae bacterium]|nr:sugar porter family MFS transporter [Steroidobacteraceae bacterium]
MTNNEARAARMGQRRLNVGFVALTAAIGGLLLGFDATVISGVVPFIREYFHLSGAGGDLRLGWAVSSLGWGALAGNAFAGVLSDRLGRRKVLLFAAMLFVLSASLASLATTLTAFVAARIVGGLAVGAAILIAPVYIAEIAPADRRGGLVSLNQLMIVIGISASFFSNYFLLDVGEHNWRWMLGVQVFPALLYLLLLSRIPESPRWLVIKGRDEQALEVLMRVAGDTQAQENLQQIRQSLAAKGVAHGWRALFDRRIRLIMLIALGLAFFQQITGINAIFYYLPTIFSQAGGGVSDAFRQAVIVGLVNVVMTVVAIRLIDRLGRKPLLVIGIAGMAVSLLTIAWAFSVVPHDQALVGVAPAVNARLVLIAIIGFVASFAISLGPVMWVLLSEIFPNEYRGVAISVAGFWNALVSASVTFVFPWELSTLGPAGVFLGYGLFASAALLFVLVFVRETKGRTLEELEGELLLPPKSTAA